MSRRHLEDSLCLHENRRKAPERRPAHAHVRRRVVCEATESRLIEKRLPTMIGAASRARCVLSESLRCRHDIAFSRAHLAKHAMRAIPPPHPTQLGVFTHQTHINLDGDRIKTGSVRGVVVTSRFRGPIWRKTQCEPSHRRIPLAWVSTHQAHINLDGGRVKTGNLRGAVVKSRFREPNSAKNAMRAIPPPHTPQLGSPRTKHISISTAIVSKRGIYKVPS